MAVTRTIVVAGAGIGGLTASLALAAQGFRVVVLEKAERLEEAGAGLQLSPNASRILVELGLQPRLAPRAVTPESINIMSARAGGEIARLPLGEAANFRAGAPYWVVHRADLQAALRAAGRRQSRHRTAARLPVRGRHRARQGTDGRAAPRQRAAAGTGGGADRRRRHLVVGAASFVPGGAAAILRPDRLARHARCHGRCRANIPRRGCSSGWDRTRISSPIRSRAARQINVVAIVPGTWNRPGWSAPGEANEIKSGVLAALAGDRADADRRRRRMAALGAVHRARSSANGATARSRCSAMPRMRCCRSPRRAPAWRSRMPRCWRNALSESAGENTAGIPAALKRYGRLRRAPRVAGAARRAAVRDESIT